MAKADGSVYADAMADKDDKTHSEKPAQFGRRAFLAGGAAVGGTVLWGASAASALTPPIFVPGNNEPPIIPGTGATGIILVNPGVIKKKSRRLKGIGQI